MTPMVRWHFGICWNRRGERSWEIIRPLLYDCRVYCGFSAGIFTLGWWRDAAESDIANAEAHASARSGGAIA